MNTDAVMCMALTRHKPSLMALSLTSSSISGVMLRIPRLAGTSNQRCLVSDFMSHFDTSLRQGYGLAGRFTQIFADQKAETRGSIVDCVLVAAVYDRRSNPFFVFKSDPHPPSLRYGATTRPPLQKTPSATHRGPGTGRKPAAVSACT